jgi:hypothetical protein
MTRILALILVFAVLVTGCASSTLIQSNPSGAKLYIDGTLVGSTPYLHRDTKIIASTTDVRVLKDGYEPYYTTFSRDEQIAVGPIIAGIFLWIPLLWVMKYNPLHTYELQALSQKDSTPKSPTPSGQSKAERLRDLKRLLDDKIINQEEFDAEKLKILGED